MSIPTPPPDPTQQARDDQDDLVEVDVDDDLPDDGSQRAAAEVDPAVDQSLGADDAEQLPPGSAL